MLSRAKRNTHGDVAQLGEHHVRNVGVVGSNPIISTMETSEPSVFWRLFFMSEAKRVHAGRRELVGSAGTVNLPGFSQRPLVIEGETWQA